MENNANFAELLSRLQAVERGMNLIDGMLAVYNRLEICALDEIEKGGKPLMVLDAQTAPKITGPAAIDGIGPTDDWQGYWQKTDASKRKAASWANGH